MDKTRVAKGTTDHEKRMAAVEFAIQRLPRSCIERMVAGPTYWGTDPLSKIPKSEIMIALRRLLFKRAGPDGRNIKEVFKLLDGIEEYKLSHPGYPMERYFSPISSVLFTNYAQHCFEVSKAHAEGKGFSIAPSVVQRAEFACKYLGFEFDLDNAVAKSIAPRQSVHLDKTCTVPLKMVLLFEEHAMNDDVWSVFVFWNRQALIHALSSLRKIEFCRSSTDLDFMEKCAHPCVAARTRNTKQGELNARWIIPTFGFLGELTWMDAHLKLLDELGSFTPAMTVSIPHMRDPDAALLTSSESPPCPLPLTRKLYMNCIVFMASPLACVRR